MAEWQWACPGCGQTQRARLYSQEEAEKVVGTRCAACSEKVGVPHAQSVLAPSNQGAAAPRFDFAEEESTKAEEEAAVQPLRSSDRSQGKSKR